MLVLMQRIAYDIYPKTKFTIIDLEYLTSQLLKKHTLKELGKMEDKQLKEELKPIINKQGA